MHAPELESAEQAFGVPWQPAVSQSHSGLLSQVDWLVTIEHWNGFSTHEPESSLHSSCAPQLVELNCEQSVVRLHRDDGVQAQPACPLHVACPAKLVHAIAVPLQDDDPAASPEAESVVIFASSSTSAHDVLGAFGARQKCWESHAKPAGQSLERLHGLTRQSSKRGLYAQAARASASAADNHDTSR
jgi:hypothetical protein